MLKPDPSLNDLERQASDALLLLLKQVSAIELRHVELNSCGIDLGVDFLAEIDVSGKRHALACQVKSSGQPRHVQTAILQLKHYVAQARDVTPIVIAPYLSADTQALCREHDVGFLDLEGNARLVFDGIFIERQVASKPAADRRELRSLFKPKSAQVLRAMLSDPRRAWRVTELAQAAAVSLGHVSNVRVALLDREWAQVSNEGLFLAAPDTLLDAWRDAYAPPDGKRLAFYTTLHGAAFDDAARRALTMPAGASLAAYASFSAARWLAPYGRTGTHYFYADKTSLQRLRSGLALAETSKGENVFITVLNDTGVLRDTVEPAPGAVCTSPVQTYLDLAHAGERGREAAAHLRREKLTWPR
jgi:hypothetical protein